MGGNDDKNQLFEGSCSVRILCFFAAVAVYIVMHDSIGISQPFNFFGNRKWTCKCSCKKRLQLMFVKSNALDAIT